MTCGHVLPEFEHLKQADCFLKGGHAGTHQPQGGFILGDRLADMGNDTALCKAGTIIKAKPITAAPWNGSSPGGALVESTPTDAKCATAHAKSEMMHRDRRPGSHGRGDS